MNKTLTYSLVAVSVLFGAVVAFVISYDTQATLASVSVTDEYVATSTAANAVYGAFTSGRVLKTGQGTLGSVVITGANTGIVNFYNATTSNVNLRGGKASSTLLMASVPASTAAGTYTIDGLFTDGLLVVLEGGTMPTTTITYR